MPAQNCQAFSFTFTLCVERDDDTQCAAWRLSHAPARDVCDVDMSAPSEEEGEEESPMLDDGIAPYDSDTDGMPVDDDTSSEDSFGDSSIGDDSDMNSLDSFIVRDSSESDPNATWHGGSGGDDIDSDASVDNSSRGIPGVSVFHSPLLLVIVNASLIALQGFALSASYCARNPCCSTH